MNGEPLRVTIELDTQVLIALVDPNSFEADVPAAQKLGLLTKKAELTWMGKLVLDASDQVALRHKIRKSSKFVANRIVDATEPETAI